VWHRSNKISEIGGSNIRVSRGENNNNSPISQYKYRNRMMMNEGNNNFVERLELKRISVGLLNWEFGLKKSR